MASPFLVVGMVGDSSESARHHNSLLTMALKQGTTKERHTKRHRQGNTQHTTQHHTNRAQQRKAIENMNETHGTKCQRTIEERHSTHFGSTPNGKEKVGSQESQLTRNVRQSRHRGRERKVDAACESETKKLRRQMEYAPSEGAKTAEGRSPASRPKAKATPLGKPRDGTRPSIRST